jgi:hypothetical protein
VVCQDLSPDDTHKPVHDKTVYRELIGSLLYVANSTRPDICLATSVLSQYLEQPREMHWRAAIRVLRYLKGTKDMGIVLSRNESKLHTYSDANWGGDIATRRSTSGVFMKLCGGPAIYKASAKRPSRYRQLRQNTSPLLWLPRRLCDSVTCSTRWGSSSSRR